MKFAKTRNLKERQWHNGALLSQLYPCLWPSSVAFLSSACCILMGIRLFAMTSTPKIRLFIKPYCGWCQQAMDWLDARGVEYETLDVMADQAAFDEMVRLSGQELAPVIEVDGK